MTAKSDSTPTKTCPKCGECKAATSEHFPQEGYGLRAGCKMCRAAAKNLALKRREEAAPEKRDARLAKAREYSAANRQKIMARQKVWVIENRDHVAKKSREYYEANADAIRERARLWKQNNPERRLENNRRWVRDNPESSAACSRRNKARRMSDPILSFVENIRRRVATSIRSGGYTKRSKTCEILGCDWDAFTRHIEMQFLKGMNWGNRSDWHIDHIVPLATAKSEADVIALNHHSNLRPIWAKDNLSKGAQITHLI